MTSADLSNFWLGFVTGALIVGYLSWSLTVWYFTTDDDGSDDDWWWKAPDYPPDDLKTKESSR